MANAVGAIAGTVMVTEEILVYPMLNNAGLEVLGYYVQTGEERLEFEELADALAHARSLSHERALGGALRSGADNPQVVVEESADGLDTYPRARQGDGQAAAGAMRFRGDLRSRDTRGLAVDRQLEVFQTMEVSDMETQRVDTQRAYELIWDRITTLGLPPGAAINEQQLAEELGMALTPVQEALKLLAHDHLVAHHAAPRHVRRRREHPRPRPTQRVAPVLESLAAAAGCPACHAR